MTSKIIMIIITLIITILLVKLNLNDINLMKAISTKKKDGGRELSSLIDICKETKVRVACYMTTSTNSITTNGTRKPSC